MRCYWFDSYPITACALAAVVVCVGNALVIWAIFGGGGELAGAAVGTAFWLAATALAFWMERGEGR